MLDKQSLLDPATWDRVSDGLLCECACHCKADCHPCGQCINNPSLRDASRPIATHLLVLTCPGSHVVEEVYLDIECVKGCYDLSQGTWACLDCGDVEKPFTATIKRI
jgi:hypothetical protein